MFAIIKTGGKQYRVTQDKVIRVEKLEALAGDSISLDEVLMLPDKTCSPPNFFTPKR